MNRSCIQAGPESLVERASLQERLVVGSRLGCATPQAIKMVLAAPLLTLAIKGSARKIQEGTKVSVNLRIFVMSQ